MGGQSSSVSAQEQRRDTHPEDVSDDSPEVSVDGAVEDNVRRKVGQQQTVGDVNSRPESEVRRPVARARLPAATHQ